MSKFKFHPLCHALPVLPKKELAALAEDIKENGQHLPILTLNGEVIDGRNRLLACQLHGIDPKIEEIESKDIPKLLGSLNYFRRHLTQSQRAMWIVKLGKWNSKMDHGDPTIEEAAKLTKTSTGTIKRARRIKKSGIKTVQNAVIEGDLSVHEGDKLSALPKSEQRKASRGGAKTMKAKAAELARKPEKGEMTLPSAKALEEPVTANPFFDQLTHDSPPTELMALLEFAADYRKYWWNRTSPTGSGVAPGAAEREMNDKIEKLLKKHGAVLE